MTMSRSTNERDRGAVIPLVALVLGALITMTAIAVDLGRLMVVRRDLQAAADVISLDMARHLDGVSTRSVLETNPSWNQQKVLTSNRNKVDPSKVVVDLGVVNRTLQQDINLSSQAYTSALAGQVPNAVKVTITDTIGYFFVPGDSGSSTRSAIGFRTGATVPPTPPANQACYSIGSFALNLDNNNTLGQLIANKLGITVLSYNGLVNSNVTLGQLANQLNLASPTQLLNQNLTFNQLVVASANALRQGGDTANANFLDGLAQQTVNNNTQFNFGGLVSVSQPAQTAALAAQFNVLNLVAGGAFLINGTNAINVPLSVPGLLSSQLTIIEGPQYICDVAGGGQLATSQIRMRVTAGVNVPLVGNIGVTADLNVANGSSVINSITCGANTSMRIDVASDVISPTISGTLPLGLSLPITTQASPTPSFTSSATFLVPPALPQQQSTGSNAVTMAAVFGGASFGGLAGSAANLLLSQILSAAGPITDPLMKQLGITIAGADVIAQRIDCVSVLPPPPSSLSTVSLVG